MLNLPHYGEACFLEIQHHSIISLLSLVLSSLFCSKFHVLVMRNYLSNSGYHYPFKPQCQHVYSPHCSPFISFVANWENLLKIPSDFIVGDHLLYSDLCFDQEVLLWGEIRCLSLLGLKGLFEHEQVQKFVSSYPFEVDIITVSIVT